MNERLIHKIFTAAAFVLLFSSVVIPCSVQLLTAAAMPVCLVLAFFVTKVNRQLTQLGLLHLLSATVTAFYLFVGVVHGAPLVAVQQILFVYVISPFMWMYIIAGLVQTIGLDRLVKWFLWLAFISCLSVALFFFLFIKFGPGAVTFFKNDANLNLTEGYAGATMYVYGSLMFLCGGFFAAPELLRKFSLRVLLLLCLALAAITSGRSALILAMPVGLSLGFLLSFKLSDMLSYLRRNWRSMTAIPLVMAVAFFGLANAAGIDVLNIFERFTTELFSGGGSVRTEQALHLLEGSYRTLGTGYGHGVGVDYLRSDNFPWRYETVWFATIFRVGILGAFIYLLPFLWYVGRFLQMFLTGTVSPVHKFMFSGFVCVFIASNTNPYIESFVFQWMYVLPVVSLFALPMERRQREEAVGTAHACLGKSGVSA